MCESVGVAAVKSVTAVSGDDACQWFVMRDLTRPNAKLPAYKLLDGLNIRTFTPMVWKLMLNHGKRERRQLPFIHDLLFVYASRAELDSVVETTPMLQYRYLRGGYKMPMTVRAADMQRFIHAVGLSSSPQYYRPDEVTPAMRNRRTAVLPSRRSYACHAQPPHPYYRRKPRRLRGQPYNHARLQGETPACGDTHAARRHGRGRDRIHTVALIPDASCRRMLRA